jgi:transcriptional regulator with XRE-family HTH domain
MDNTLFLKDNLKRRRKNADLTQAELAEIVDISVRGYQKYEQGISTPSPEKLSSLARALKCEVSDLYENPNKHLEVREGATTYGEPKDIAKQLANIEALIKNNQEAKSVQSYEAQIEKMKNTIKDLQAEIKLIRSYDHLADINPKLPTIFRQLEEFQKIQIKLNEADAKKEKKEKDVVLDKVYKLLKVN